MGPPVAQIKVPLQAGPLPQRQVLVASHHSPALQQMVPQQGPFAQRLHADTQVSPAGGPARSTAARSIFFDEEARSTAPASPAAGR